MLNVFIYYRIFFFWRVFWGISVLWDIFWKIVVIYKYWELINVILSINFVWRDVILINRVYIFYFVNF